MKRTIFTRKVLLILLLFSSLSGAKAQSKSKLQLRISPLNMLDARAPTLPFGVQATIKNKVGFIIEYGLPYKGLAKQYVKNQEYLYPYHDYYKLRSEIKYFMLEGKKTKPYLSAEVFFSPERYRKTDSWIVKEEGDFHYEYSDINRWMWGGCLKIGLEYYFGQRFLVDAFVGPGLRWIEVDHQTFGEQPDDYEVPADYLFEPVDRQEGKFTRIHLGLNIKFGYVILK